MKPITIFLYEWKHFLRSPFKIIAVFLFVVAAVYGLFNGSNLYHKQFSEVKKIEENVAEERKKYLTQYEEGQLVPEGRPWINMSAPFWAIWYTPTYHIKTPSPAMVYSIGQTEQYGFYKQVSFWASPYDADMAEEIANPERLQTGTLDFAFVVLYLLPLLLLILVYNIKSKEAELGFLPLVEVQAGTSSTWSLTRLLFYFTLCAFILILLMIFGASLTSVFKSETNSFIQMLGVCTAYLLLWTIIYYFIIKRGKSILGNTLKMIGFWLIIAFVIPAAVHQLISIKNPVNLMTDFIEVRDQQQDLYNQPDSIFQQELIKLFPLIKTSPVYNDSTKVDLARNRSAAALVNELKKKSIQPIEKQNLDKNTFIASSFWFNPMSFFQNKLNEISQTHYNNYQDYRNEIQQLIDKRIAVLIKDLWNDVEVDKERYLEYNKELN